MQQNIICFQNKHAGATVETPSTVDGNQQRPPVCKTNRRRAEACFLHRGVMERGLLSSLMEQLSPCSEHHHRRTLELCGELVNERAGMLGFWERNWIFLHCQKVAAGSAAG